MSDDEEIRAWADRYIQDALEVEQFLKEHNGSGSFQAIFEQLGVDPDELGLNKAVDASIRTGLSDEVEPLMIHAWNNERFPEGERPAKQGCSIRKLLEELGLDPDQLGLNNGANNRIKFGLLD